MQGILSNVRDYPWQFFVTLTFKREASTGVRLSMWFALFREQGRCFKVHPASVRWLLRSELGEVSSRFHYHCLIAGLPLRALTLRNCRAIESQWEALGGGMARARLYSGSFHVAEYVLKGLLDSVTVASAARRDDHELSKFSGGTCNLMLSACLQRELAFVLRKGRKVGLTADSPINEKRDGLGTRSKTGERSNPLEGLTWATLLATTAVPGLYV